MVVPPVLVAPVEAMRVEDRIEATGELRAQNAAAIAAQVGGQVTKLVRDEGDRSRRGRRGDRDRSRAPRPRAAQRARDAAAGGRPGRRGQRDLARFEKLHAQGVAPDAKLDSVRTQLRTARTNRDAAQAQLGMAERGARDSSVRAPFAGLVARRYVSEGEFVQPGQKLFDLVALDPIEVEFTLPERDSSRVVMGQPVDVRVAPFPDEVFRAEVTVIAPTIDPMTRTLRVKARMANSDGRLRPGLFARADLGVAVRENVAMIPEEAVLQRADGAVAYRVARRAARAERRSHQGRRDPRRPRRGARRTRDRRSGRGARPGSARRRLAGLAARHAAGATMTPNGVRRRRREDRASGEGATVTLSEVSIRRPILTWMMTLALVMFGVLGFLRLGVDQFPNMEFPVLTVQAALEGATPEGIEEDVTDVLEEHLNTIGGVRSIRSTSYQGVALIVVEFELGTDLDVAAQDVRDKVALARVALPTALEPPVVGTFNPNDSPVLWIPFDSRRAGRSRPARRCGARSIRIMETIPGVAGVAMFGRQDRNIRIWLDGDALRARGLAATDVLGALQREHVETPGGAGRERRASTTR